MNFDFSDELKQLRDEANRMLREQCPPKAVRRVLDGAARYDAPLWRQIGELGWLGAGIPEEYGGSGLGREGLCVLAEEVGRALAPVPFSSSVYLATEAIMELGNDTQKQAWLPLLAGGKLIGTFALAEDAGNPSAGQVRAEVSRGRITGAKLPVPNGNIADFAVVAARDVAGTPGLYHVELKGPGVERRSLRTIDPSCDHAKLVFNNAPAVLLGASACGWAGIKRLLDRAAVLVAFEQLGGAQACLDMAKNYAMERYAFGRPIGSFQAIKHKLADIFVAIELARSNAYYGAWAISTDAVELPLAAATARISATDAYHLASKENIQTHGGMGCTWEFDCHLYYRRAKLLGLTLGSAPYWRGQLLAELDMRHAA